MLNVEAVRLNASALALTLLFMVGFYLIYRDMRKMEENSKHLAAEVDNLAKMVSDMNTAFSMPFDFQCDLPPSFVNMSSATMHAMVEELHQDHDADHDHDAGQEHDAADQEHDADQEREVLETVPEESETPDEQKDDAPDDAPELVAA